MMIFILILKKRGIINARNFDDFRCRGLMTPRYIIRVVTVDDDGVKHRARGAVLEETNLVGTDVEVLTVYRVTMGTI